MRATLLTLTFQGHLGLCEACTMWLSWLCKIKFRHTQSCVAWLLGNGSWRKFWIESLAVLLYVTLSNHFDDLGYLKSSWCQGQTGVMLGMPIMVTARRPYRETDKVSADFRHWRFMFMSGWRPGPDCVWNTYLRNGYPYKFTTVVEFVNASKMRCNALFIKQDSSFV